MRSAQRGLTSQLLSESAASLEIIEAYPDDEYLPSYLVRAEGQAFVFHIQIATDVAGDNVRIVTMYVPDPNEWDAGFRERKAS